jgi:hypothetical protein
MHGNNVVCILLWPQQAANYNGKLCILKARLELNYELVLRHKAKGGFLPVLLASSHSLTQAFFQSSLALINSFFHVGTRLGALFIIINNSDPFFDSER